MDRERDYIKIATDYATNAVADRKQQRHCKWVRLACRRHINDLKKASRRKGWDYHFDPEYAEHICMVMESFEHVEGVWDDPSLILADWQVFCLVVQFGWRRGKRPPIDERGNKLFAPRRFTSAYWEVARKNGKSTTLGAAAIYGLFGEEEPGAQIIIGATTGEQALKVFRPAKMMAERNSALEEFGVDVRAKSVLCGEYGSFMQPINSKGKTQDGWNPHWGILDELHAHDSRDLYDVIRSAFGARKNPLMWVITTAGTNVYGVCYEEQAKVRRMLDGVIELDHYFGIIYTIDEKDDPFDPECWCKANPNLGLSVQADELASYAKEAQVNPAQAADFQTKRLNLWLSSGNSWLNMQRYKRCESKGLPELEAKEKAIGCVLGLDVSKSSDFTALVKCYFWKDYSNRHTYAIYPALLCTEHNVRHDRTQMLYKWHAAELIRTMGEDEISMPKLQDFCKTEYFDSDAIELAYDPALALQLAQQLSDEDVVCVEYRQGPMSMTPAMYEYQNAVNAGRLLVEPNEAFRWMHSNIIVKERNDLIKPEKERSENKIDGPVAAIMAVGRANMIMAEDEAGAMDDYLAALRSH